MVVVWVGILELSLSDFLVWLDRLLMVVVVSCLGLELWWLLVLSGFLFVAWMLCCVISLLLGLDLGGFVGFSPCGLVWYVFWCLWVS